METAGSVRGKSSLLTCMQVFPEVTHQVKEMGKEVPMETEIVPEPEDPQEQL